MLKCAKIGIIMDNTITVNTFSQVKAIIKTHLKGGFSNEKLEQVKELFYFNAKGDLKGYDFYYINREFVETLIYSYKMEDKSLFQFILSLSLKFSSSSYRQEKPLCAKSHASLGQFFRSLIQENESVIIDLFKAIHPIYTEGLGEYGWTFHDFFKSLIEKKKYEVLKALFHPNYIESKALCKVLSMEGAYSGYEKGYVMLSPAQCRALEIDNLINAIAHNDITCLNIFLKANARVIKQIDLKKLNFIDNEAITYLKIVRAQGFIKTQNIFKFNLEDDLNLAGGEKIKTLIQTMNGDFIQTLTQGKGKIVNTTHIQEKTSWAWVENFQKKISGLKFKKAKSASLIDDTTLKQIKEQQLTQEMINTYFDFIYQNELQTDEKTVLLTLQALILKILSIGEMNVKIKCDILLILQEKLPSLTQSYVELIKQDSHQRAIYLNSYVQSITLIYQQFNLYYEELHALKTQKLALSFTENVVFLEKKYLKANQ
jgi:hypothetical protein